MKLTSYEKTVIIGIMLTFMLVPFAACHRISERDDVRPIGTTVVTVREGDTLWSIAEKYCPDEMDIHEYIDDIKHDNHCGTLIYAGDKLRVDIY